MAIFTYALNAAMPDACRGGVLTIGNFDGVHIGHQALLAETARLARAMPGPAVAVTFDPHPSQILRPDKIGPPLSTLADRASWMQECGAEHVLILQTSSELLRLTAREFFEKIIVEQLRAKAIVEGFNFGFGRDRVGTVDLLKALCQEYGVQLTLLPPQEMLGQPVSSGRIRAEVLAGNVDIARQLLGRPHRIAGIVGTGAKRGATLGFPTANLHDVTTLLPGNGVYTVRVHVDGSTWPGAANVGPNPTFGENARKVEVHLIGFSGDLYEKTLLVDFIEKIRDTKPFASAQELVAQIQTDVASARKILGGG